MKVENKFVSVLLEKGNSTVFNTTIMFIVFNKQNILVHSEQLTSVIFRTEITYIPLNTRLTACDLKRNIVIKWQRAFVGDG